MHSLVSPARGRVARQLDAHAVRRGSRAKVHGSERVSPPCSAGPWMSPRQPCSHWRYKARSRGSGLEATPLPLSAGTPAQTESTQPPQGEGLAQVRSRGPGCQAAPLPLSGDAPITPRELNPRRGRTWLKSARRTPRGPPQARSSCEYACCGHCSS